MRASPSSFECAATMWLTLMGLGCGAVADEAVIGDGKRATLWHCVGAFDRVVVHDALNVHICPPPGDVTLLDRWVGDVVCDSQSSAAAAAGTCSGNTVRVDIIGDEKLVSLVDAVSREGELVLDSREKLVSRQGIGTPTKYIPVVVLVRESVRDVEARGESHVVVDGISADGAETLRVEAHDRAEVIVAGEASNLLVRIGERASVDASGLVADTAELEAMGDDEDALDVGGRASAQLCARRNLILTSGPELECGATTVQNILTRAVDVTACCVADPGEGGATRAFKCGSATEANCTGVPVCSSGPAVGYGDCPIQ
jgi:hypothetical protein